MEVIGRLLASGILPSVKEPLTPIESLMSPGFAVDAIEKGIISCPWQEPNHDSLVIHPITVLYELCYPNSISCLWHVLRCQLIQDCKCNCNTKTGRALCLCNIVSLHSFPEIFYFVLPALY